MALTMFAKAQNFSLAKGVGAGFLGGVSSPIYLFWSNSAYQSYSDFVNVSQDFGVRVNYSFETGRHGRFGINSSYSVSLVKHDYESYLTKYPNWDNSAVVSTQSQFVSLGVYYGVYNRYSRNLGSLVSGVVGVYIPVSSVLTIEEGTNDPIRYQQKIDDRSLRELRYYSIGIEPSLLYHRFKLLCYFNYTIGFSSFETKLKQGYLAGLGVVYFIKN